MSRFFLLRVLTACILLGGSVANSVWFSGGRHSYEGQFTGVYVPPFHQQRERRDVLRGGDIEVVWRAMEFASYSVFINYARADRRQRCLSRLRASLEQEIEILLCYCAPSTLDPRISGENGNPQKPSFDLCADLVSCLWSAPPIKRWPKAYESFNCGTSTRILKDEPHSHMQSLIVMSNSVQAKVIFVVGNPRTLIALKQAQLAANFTIGTAESEPREEGGSDSKNGRPRYDPGSKSESSSVSYNRIIFGVVIVLLGWIILGKGINDAGDYSYPDRRFVLGLIAIIAGAAVMIHGLFLACTGTFFPWAT